MKNKYYIGVFKEEFCNYVLMCYQEGALKSIIKMGQMKIQEEVDFDNMINNMSEYFNAEVIVEDFIDRRSCPKKSAIKKEKELRGIPSKTDNLENIIVNFPYHKGKTITVDQENGIETAIKLWALNEKSIEIK